MMGTSAAQNDGALALLQLLADPAAAKRKVEEFHAAEQSAAEACRVAAEQTAQAKLLVDEATAVRAVAHEHEERVMSLHDKLSQERERIAADLSGIRERSERLDARAAALKAEAGALEQRAVALTAKEMEATARMFDANTRMAEGTALKREYSEKLAALRALAG